MRLIRLGTILLLTGITMAAMADTAMAQRFNPKNRGLPGRREGGGTRGACSSAKGSMVALMPIDNFGTTISDRPTLQWFVPTTEPTKMMLVLLDDQGEEIYSGEFSVTGQSDLVRFTLPQEAPALEVGKMYQWRSALVCDSDDLSSSMMTEGWIHRVAVSPSLQTQLASANGETHGELYAEAGLWYDMADQIAKRYQNQPNNPTVQKQWNALLESVELKPWTTSQKLADVKVAPTLGY
jgi:hypothetical protein